jgi:hypothetical protein
LVFVGILAAFALDSWWAQRGEHELEAAYLTGLRSDFATAEAEVDRLLERHRLADSQFTELHRLLRSGEGAEYPDSVVSLTHGLWSTWVYTPRLPTYENLLATVGLEILESEQLRQALMAYALSVDYNAGWDRFLIAFDQNRMMAMLAPRVPFFDYVFEDGDAGGRLRPDVNELAKDLEFRNLIAIRAYGERELIKRRSDLRETILDVRKLLDAEER